MALHQARHRAVDEHVLIADARRFKAGLVFLLIQLSKNVLEAVVVLLGDRVLGGEPQILLQVQRILEAGMSKGADGSILVIGPLQYAGALEIVNGLAEGFPPALIGEHQLRFSLPRHTVLSGFVDVAVGMAGNGDGRFPGAYHRVDVFHHDGCAKYRSVEQSAQRPVGTFPHPAEVVFLHALGVWRDCGALDAHTVPRNGPGRVHGHLIFRRLPLQKAQIVVLRAQIHIRLNQRRLDLAPQNTGHFIAVQLHQRRGHLNFFHGSLPFLKTPS